ncbi:MAG: tetratricopeptide repeat protein [Novosphingobium sp.]
MALPPTTPPADGKTSQSDGFLREVDDALREAEFLDNLKRYGKPLGAAVVLGLAGLGGWLYWQSSQRSAEGEAAERYSLALDRIESGDLDAGLRELAPLAAEGSNAHIAKLMVAAAKLEQGKPEDAAKGFAAVALDGDAPQPLRDLALVREIAIRFDTLPPQQVIDRLKPLAVPGNPWFGSAGEMSAMAWLKAGDKDRAGPLFVAVSKDKTAPESVRARTRQMAGLLGFDAIDDVVKAAGGEGETTDSVPTQAPTGAAQ